MFRSSSWICSHHASICRRIYLARTHAFNLELIFLGHFFHSCCSDFASQSHTIIEKLNLNTLCTRIFIFSTNLEFRSVEKFEIGQYLYRRKYGLISIITHINFLGNHLCTWIICQVLFSLELNRRALYCPYSNSFEFAFVWKTNDFVSV